MTTAKTQEGESLQGQDVNRKLKQPCISRK